MLIANELAPPLSKAAQQLNPSASTSVSTSVPTGQKRKRTSANTVSTSSNKDAKPDINADNDTVIISDDDDDDGEEERAAKIRRLKVFFLCLFCFVFITLLFPTTSANPSLQARISALELRQNVKPEPHETKPLALPLPFHGAVLDLTLDD